MMQRNSQSPNEVSWQVCLLSIYLHRVRVTLILLFVPYGHMDRLLLLYCTQGSFFQTKGTVDHHLQFVASCILLHLNTRGFLMYGQMSLLFENSEKRTMIPESINFTYTYTCTYTSTNWIVMTQTMRMMQKSIESFIEITDGTLKICINAGPCCHRYL